MKDLFTARPVKLSRATPTGAGGWVKDENFSRSQIVSFAVHGGLAMFLLLSLTGKIPVPDKVKQLLPLIYAPDPGIFRTLILKRNPDSGHGGGGGGDRNPIPATGGQTPRFSMDVQIVPPSLVSNPNPAMRVTPILHGDQQPPTINSDLNRWGDPSTRMLTDSNGPGTDGGIGGGKGGGIGPGTGPGAGPGSGGGWGGNVFSPGGGSGITYPECVYCPRPDYSDEARHNRYQGSVILNVVVLPNGRAGKIEIVKSPGMGLDEKAIEAVHTWLFKAAKGPDGKPVAVVVPVEVSFQLF